MKIVMINVVCGIRSTGRICTDLALALEEQGHEVKIAYGRENVPVNFQKYAVRIGSDVDVRIHGLRARLFDDCGWGSKRATEKFITWLKKYDPDVIHLHNIHGYYINIEILFRYLKKCGKRIIWTLHDCWAFTGHAAYCELVNCERWIEGCYDCPKRKDYPATSIDRSKRNWQFKRDIFSSVPNMTIITPSLWLSDLVKKSYLKEYRTIVINNGIDINRFKRIDPSQIRKKYHLENKRIILGVAAIWNERKGLEDFIKLRKELNNEYVIILLGLSKKQISRLPSGIIGIEHTNTVNELVELYSLADIFINPTYEDNYPTTNLESIACGTPVITYNTGGSGESASLFGTVFDKGDVESMYKYIENYQENYQENFCSINREKISITTTISKYLKIYNIQ